MADAEMSTLSFEIEGKGADTTSSQIESIKDSLKSLKSIVKDLPEVTKNLKNVDLSSATQSLKGFVQEVQNITNEDISKVERLADAYKKLGGCKGISKATKKDKLVTSDGANEYTTSLTDSFDATVVDDFKDAPLEISDAFQGTTNSVKEFTKELVEAKGANDSLKNSTESLDIAKAFKNTATITSFKNELKATADTFKYMWENTKGLQKFLVKPFVDVGKLFGKKFFVEPIQNVKKLIDGAKSLGKAIARIALYRAIRSMLKALSADMEQGINNMYRYSQTMDGRFASSMDRLATSGAYLSNSLGAMAAPIVNSLAPALDFLIDKIVELLNWINQLFAALSGATSWTKAVKGQKSYGDTLDKTGKSAGKAAKEIRDATGSIDELNIISQNNSSGGGGGGIDTSGMFENVMVDAKVSDFIQKLKDDINAGDWYGAGVLLGTKFNELVEQVDWKGLGNKFGTNLNNAISLGLGFLRTADFSALGGGLAEFVNGAIEAINWNNAGALMIRGFTSVIDMVRGFFLTLDYGLIATSISNYIKGALNEASDWLDEQDAYSIGSKIYQSVSDFFENLDYKGLGASIGRFFLKAWAFGFTLWGSLIKGLLESLGIRDFIIALGGDPTDWDNLGTNTQKNINDWIDKLLPAYQGSLEKAKHPSREAAKQYMLNNLDAFNNPDGTTSAGHMKLTTEDIVNGYNSTINGRKGSSISTTKLYANDVNKTFSNTANGKTFGGFATDNINGFNDTTSKKYVTSQKPISGWGKYVNEWFSKSSNGKHFDKFATENVTGFNSGINAKYTTSKVYMNTWGNDTINTFKKSSPVSNWTAYGRNTVEGYNGGIEAKMQDTFNTVLSWASKAVEGFKNFLGIHSPSKVFEENAMWTVKGYNEGIEENASSTYKVLDKWADGIAKTELPDFMAVMNVDESQLSNAINSNKSAFSKSLTAQINSNADVNFSGNMYQALERFYELNMKENMNKIVEDTRRQADKNEVVNVQIGNRDVANAVREQQDANGYSFV